MFTFKKCLIALSINLAVVSSGFAWTTLIGRYLEASADGSMLVARSADSDALKAQAFCHSSGKAESDRGIQHQST